jgi:hypothetical protein
MSTTDAAINGYGVIQHQRERILAAIDDLSGVAETLEMAKLVEILDPLRRRVASDVFRVLVLGEFRRGKSTVINALLGQKVLPAFAVPTTATVNEVKWGETPRAVLYPRSGESPREIPVEELAAHVTIGADDERENPYRLVEVFWPLELCRNRVQISDVPGLNEHARREKVTMEHLADVDAIVFVLAADQLGGMGELKVVREVLKPLGHDHLFFVVNRINLIDPSERDVVIERGTRRIERETQFGAEGVFFVDAKGALEARIGDDEERFAATGFPRLEQALERFLTRDRGKLKILAPANEIRNTLKELLAHRIPEMDAMLSEELETLEARVAEAEGPLRALEAERDLITQKLDASILQIRTEVVTAARTFYEDVGTQIPAWTEDCTVETDLKLFGRNEQQMEVIAAEVAGQLESKLEAAFADWQTATLQPLVESRVATLAGELDEEARAFLANADNLRVEIAGLEGRLNEGVELGHRDASALERVVAAGGGLIIAGPGAAVMAASGGTQGLVRSLLPQLALGIAGMVVLGPGVALVALLFGAGFLQGFLGLDKAKGKARTEVGKAVVRELRMMQDERAQEVGAAVAAQLGGLRDEVATGLTREIAQVHEQIDTVLCAKRSGQEAIDAKRRMLADARRRLDLTGDVVNGVLVDLVAM